MNEFELLIKTLHQFGSIDWINQYFDLLKKLLSTLQLEDDDPRLALSLSKNKTLPVNIGQRYVLKPLNSEYIRCIVPASFEEKIVDGRLICYYSPNTSRDSKWIQVHYPSSSLFPMIVFDACVDACFDLLSKTKKSGYRKYHRSLLYHFTMEPAVRNEVLMELKKKIIKY